MVIAAGVGAAAAVGSAAMSASAASSAAGQEAAASKLGIQAQEDMFRQNQANQSPFFNEGQNALTVLNSELPYLNSPTVMDESTLQQTPGYQFTLDQGLKSTQSSAAARGLGVSGAALKGAATFATGLADSTYQQQFQNEQANKAMMFNQLLGLGQLGSNAAASLGNNSTQTANSIQSGYNAIGNAQAAGTIGTANAIGNGLTGVANAYGQYAAGNALLSNNYGGGSGGLYATPNLAQYGNTVGGGYTVQ